MCYLRCLGLGTLILILGFTTGGVSGLVAQKVTTAIQFHVQPVVSELK